MFVAFVNKAKQVSNFDKRYFAIRVTKTQQEVYTQDIVCMAELYFSCSTP